jgi:TELO2-interacting protein 1
MSLSSSLSSPPAPQRAAVFQRLKPLCIAVSEHALRMKTASSPLDLQQSLSALQSALLSVDDRNLLTPAIADYVFFPLSHILRRKDEWTDRVLELTLGCVRLLLESSWSGGLGDQMLEQFCLMFVVITEGKKKSVPEEVKAASVGCLLALFVSAKKSMKVDAALKRVIRGSKLRPLMGHTATVLLDVVTKEELLSLRLDALQTLSLLYVSLLGNGQIIASFLPLTVSSLSRCLSSSTMSSNHKLLVSLVNVLRESLSLVMDDSLKPTSRPASTSEMYHTDMTESWYRATKGQVKIALESFFPPMRTHSHHLVREAVIMLSEELLCNCSRTLDVCRSLFLETILSSQHDPFPSVREVALLSLQRLHAKDSLKSVVRECIEECLHTWCLALPRTMTSNNDVAKVNLLQRITSAVEFFSTDDNAISPSLETLLGSIQDVVVFDKSVSTTAMIQPSQSLQLTFREQITEAAGLSLQYSKEENVATSLEALLHAIGRTGFANQMVDKLTLDASIQTPRSASNAWIALHILRGTTPPADQVDELCSLATDWLLQSDSLFSATDIPTPTIVISLDILAFTASTQGLAFRQKLIDILYPTLSLLSHAAPEIQSAARQTLEQIAVSTGYNDISTLILANTDYLVNSVALKLNVFEVSLQVLATLYTVTKLAGPRIVPYLDDIWGSLFDVVDRFHGYEKLVTAVFAVMTSVVDVISQTISFPPPPSIETSSNIHDSVCSEIKDLIDTILANEEHLPPKITAITIPKPPPLPAKTASLLQTLARKSVLLTTHPSPHLRFNLLHLLRKSLPLLSIPSPLKDGEQDPFLPLLAQEVWPAICSRLTDKESWVVNAALESIAEVLALEGEFLGPKIGKDVWPPLRGIISPKTGKTKNGVVTKDEIVERDAVVRVVCAIMSYTNQKPWLVDEMLGCVWPWIQRGGEDGEKMSRAFERKNGDAVWLMEQVDPRDIPIMENQEGFFVPVQYQ